MSNIRKISKEVTKYIVDKKKRNPDLSCRKLTSEASERFKLKISKSSINQIIIDNNLSSPVGRRTSKNYALSQEASGCGYAFLLGANYKLGLSEIVAKSLKMAHPIVNLSKASIETFTLSWIMSRAFYNVALDRIADYSKNEIWPLIGRKVAKGQLQRYLAMFKIMQTVNNNIVTELSHVLQDVLCIKVTLADGSIFYLDGQGKSVWSDKNMPLVFSTTINVTNSYINKVFFGNDPFLIFSASPESHPGDAFWNFVSGLDGSMSGKRIQRVDCLDLKGIVIKEVTNIMPLRRKFVVGVWPSQMKSIDEAVLKNPKENYYLDSLDLKYSFVESPVKFTQHVNNKDVALRTILIMDPAAIGVKHVLLTNMHPEEAKARDILSAYLRRYPFFETSHKFFVQAVKNPVYADDYVTAESIFSKAKVILECQDPDQIFSILVEVLNNFSKKCFFSQACSSWSLLKMRELFYKRPGRIKRDLADDILFKIFNSNKLQEIDKWEYASSQFNDAGIFEPSGKHFWLTLL